MPDFRNIRGPSVIGSSYRYATGLGYSLFGLCLVVAVVASCTACIADTGAYDPLLWDDVVIRGVVETVEFSSLSPEQWYSPEIRTPSMGAVELVFTTIRISEAMRGRLNGPSMVIVYGRSDDPREELKLNQSVKPGVEIVATAIYKADTASYVARLIMVNDRGSWHCVRGSLKGEPLSSDEIRARVESVGVARMTSDSDLVVLGTIISSQEVGEPGGQHQIFEIESKKILKGVAPPRFNLRSSLAGAVHDRLRTRIPSDLPIGTEWYFFLKDIGDAYVAVAGTRALFKVEGATLFEYRRVPSAFSPDMLEKDVKRFSVER